MKKTLKKFVAGLLAVPALAVAAAVLPVQPAQACTWATATLRVDNWQWDYVTWTAYECRLDQYFYNYSVQVPYTAYRTESRTRWAANPPVVTNGSQLVSSRTLVKAVSGNADDRAKNALFNSDSKDGDQATYAGAKKRDALGVTAIDETGKGKDKSKAPGRSK